MAARRNRNTRRRNRGRFGGLYKLLSVLLIFAAILLGCLVFFRVDRIEVTGAATARRRSSKWRASSRATTFTA